MRKRSNMMPRTDAPSLGKFAARLVTGNPITEDISPLAKKNKKAGDPLRNALDRPGRPKHGGVAKNRFCRRDQ